VGCHNAMWLFCKNPQAFEHEVLGSLGLRRDEEASQVVRPEPVLDLMHALVSTLGVMADLSDDFRHLARPEIGEIGPPRKKVGSTAIPRKLNPVDFEFVKSIWKAMMPRMATVYMDQLSEHQRDLTNSASQRFQVELMYAVGIATRRLCEVLPNVHVDVQRMLQNLRDADVGGLKEMGHHLRENDMFCREPVLEAHADRISRGWRVSPSVYTGTAMEFVLPN